MKVLCTQCERLINLEVFRLDGSALIVTCTRCGAESRVERAAVATNQVGGSRAARISLASTEGGSNVVVLRTAGHEAVQKAARSAEEAPFAVPEGVCPKCIAPRSAAASCAHCGILFESFDESSVTLPQWLSDEWVEVLRDWGNEAKHSQLRRKAQQRDALAAVGRLYRLRQAFVPEDPVAQEGLADVLRLAALAISFHPVDEEDVARRKRVALVIVLSLLIFVLVIGLLVQLARLV